MAALVCILDNHYNIINKVGRIHDEVIFTIVDTAKILDLKCLNFICGSDDAYFNIKQIWQIKDEVNYLRSYTPFSQQSHLNMEAINTIEKGINGVLEIQKGYLLFFSD